MEKNDKLDRIIINSNLLNKYTKFNLFRIII